MKKILVYLSKKSHTVLTMIEKSNDRSRMSWGNEAYGEGAFQSKHIITSFKRNKGGTTNQCSPVYAKDAEKRSKCPPCLIYKKINPREKNCWNKEIHQWKKLNYIENEWRLKN